MLYNLTWTTDEFNRILEIREAFKASHSRCREMTAIHQIADVLGIKVTGNILMLEDILWGNS